MKTFIRVVEVWVPSRDGSVLEFGGGLYGDAPFFGALSEARCFAMGEGFKMMASPLVREAYERVLESARRHGVAVVGGPVLGGDADACRKAVEDGITIFSVGLDLLGFRGYCEQMSRAVTGGLDGTPFSRANRPASLGKLERN